MDWGIVERLAPSLAWPIVAFIALPFVIWKLDELIGAIGHAKSLSEQLPELLKLTSEIARTAKNVDAIRENTEQIRGSQKVEHAERLAEEAGPEELLDGGAQAQEATEATTPLVPSRATSQTFKKLYEQLAKSWGGVLAALEGAYDRASLGVPDKRSVGSAALRLSDGRRRNHLSVDDAEMLAELHGLYKRYGRLRSTRPQELNSEIVEAFIAKSKDAILILNDFGT